MRILWLVNTIIPCIAEDLRIKYEDVAGWLSGLSKSLLTMSDIELAICFPNANFNKINRGKVGNLEYYGFPKKNSNNTYSKITEEYLTQIINEYNPDIVHIFGTEYPHSLSMTKVFKNPNRITINIQGLCSVYAKHCNANLPNRVISSYTLRDLIKRGSLKYMSERFSKRGLYEIEALKRTNHIIGRTDWDRACTSQINPNAEYHFCNETLRDEFYNHEWDINNCKRHTIFISQMKSPIKGVHYLLESMQHILREFPDTIIYTTGTDVFKIPWYRITSYQKYIAELISKYKLKNKVHFLGMLNEKDMCQQYLSAHVFVSPSSIENESNSISEAKIMGVPVVASFVGGVTNRIEHYNDGFLYQHDAPYMLAYYVCKIFEDDTLALKLSNNAKTNARKLHDRENNLRAMLNIYEEMMKK